MKRRISLLVVLAVLLAIAIVCGNLSPTSTPAATPTVSSHPAPAAADTPVPVVADTPAPTATAEPPAAPLVFTGTGDDIVDLDRPAGPALLRITGNAAGRHFAVNSYDGAGNPMDLLVNTTELYAGTRPLDFMQDEHAARLEISATGEWTVRVLPVTSARVLEVPGAIKGTGDDVILLRGRPDLAAISGNPGGRYFAVLGYDGGRVLLVNTTDVYEGTVMLDAETVALEVQAVGAWTVEVTGH